MERIAIELLTPPDNERPFLVCSGPCGIRATRHSYSHSDGSAAETGKLLVIYMNFKCEECGTTRVFGTCDGQYGRRIRTTAAAA